MNYLNELNEKQFQAVTTNFKKVLIVAGAGSGKTKVLTNRIKYLLDNGINKNQIIAFTFTKRAAIEMKNRLNNEFENIYTFHSYCYQMLQIAKDEIGFNKFKTINIVEEEYELQILDDIIKELDLKYSSKVLLQYVTKRKNNLPYNTKTTLEANIFNKIYYKFQEYLQSHGQIDFDDMISLFVNNIDNLSFKEELLLTTKYILVDEFQDTNQIQYNLLKKLSQKYNNLFCVGDINQLIYSFRSSDVKIINDFKEQADEIIYLNQNYRCASNILEKANSLIKHNKNLNDDIFSNINPKFKIVYHEFPDTNYQAWDVVHKIKTLIEKGNYNPQDIAILYRNNNQSQELEYELNNNKIPYTLYGKLKFNKYPKTKQIIAFYKYLDNQQDLILLKQAILLDEAIYQQIKKEPNKNILDQIINLNLPISPTANQIKQLLINIHNYDRKELFNQIQLILFNTLDDNQEYIRALKDIILTQENKTYKEILDNLLLEDDTPQNIKGVNLLTIHKAKGLEFKCVFIISLNNGLIPSNLKYEEDIKEERRLLYVAMTRAKDYLYLSSAEYHNINGMKKRLRPSLFVGEIK